MKYGKDRQRGKILQCVSIMQNTLNFPLLGLIASWLPYKILAIIINSLTNDKWLDNGITTYKCLLFLGS